MRKAVLFPFLFILGLSLNAQDVGDRSLVLEEITIPNMPGLQSFAWGQHNGEWLLLGGRTDGLHRRQPWAAFLASDNNTMAYVVDPSTGQVWSAPLSQLPTPIFEQLQSTNMEYQHRNETLYIIGGYGYAASAADHITHPAITAVDLPGAIGAVKNGTPLTPHFRQLIDTRMEVTGGYMGTLGDQFLLVGGQRFIGRYNPQGPNNGPGFIQEYTNAIRRFRIDDDGVNMAIADYSETIDTLELHRRDYNLVAQVFPDGSHGYTAFSGVFQYGQNIPWLNAVDVTDSGYAVIPVFEQLLNQYHTAHMAAHDAGSGHMYAVFFGGIGRYYFDTNGTLVDDANVPFVNTISRVERDAQGMLEETAIGEMPALLGAGAEFIPSDGIALVHDNVIDLAQLSADTVLAGHIVGGIQSSARNIFFINDGTQSDASIRVFRVWLVRDVTTGTPTMEERPAEMLRVDGSGSNEWIITVDLPAAGMVEIDLLDSSGRQVRRLFGARMIAGPQRLRATVNDLAHGPYMVRLRSGELRRVVRVAH